MKCLCREILGREDKILYVHLSGCPDSVDVKEYEKLSWYRKLFKYNPSKLYNYHTRV